MNSKLCVFSAYPYTDIDALACAVAYAELKDCVAYLPGPLNATVPDSVRGWGLQYVTVFPDTAEHFVMVDFSNPDFVPPQIPLEKIVQLYDHHTGFEGYWGQRGQIEFIGACATMIYELFGDRKPSPLAANILMTAIFANTLNFRSNVTTDRDRAAYEKLKKYATLSDEWIPTYYLETEKLMFSDMKTAIENDLKIMNQNLAVAQLELWDARDLLNDAGFMDTLKSVMSKYAHWLMIMPSISEGKDYLITNDPSLKNSLTKNFEAIWSQNIGTTPKIYLRKEFRKTLGWK